MAAAEHREDKVAALRRHHALNPRPQAVSDPAFITDNPFFDPRDLVQVKYEMLRRVRQEGQPVSQASAAFGFSRPSFYQAQAVFEEAGLPVHIPTKTDTDSGRKRTRNPAGSGRGRSGATPGRIELSGGLAVEAGPVVGEAYSTAVAVVMWAGRRAVQARWSGWADRCLWTGARGQSVGSDLPRLSTGRHLHSLVRSDSDDLPGAAARAAGCSSRDRAGDEIGHGHRLVAVRARPARAQPAAEGPAALTALGAEVALIAGGALVDDGVLGEAAGEDDGRLVGGRPPEPEAALTTSVRAPDPAGVAQESEPAGGTGPLYLRSRRGVTQRGRLLARACAWRGP